MNSRKFNKVLAVVIVAVLCVTFLPISTLAGMDPVEPDSGISEPANTPDEGEGASSGEAQPPAPAEDVPPVVDTPEETQPPVTPEVEEPVADSSVPEAPVVDSSVVADSSVPEEPVDDASVPEAPADDSSVPEEPVDDSSVPETPVEHTVYFLDENGVEITHVTVADGAALGSVFAAEGEEGQQFPTAPDKEGYAFDTWYDRDAADQLYTVDTFVTSVDAANAAARNIYLMPQYTENGEEEPPVSPEDEEPGMDVEEEDFVTVTFMVEGAAYGEPLTIKSGTTAAPPADPGLPENAVTFLGWFTQPVGGEKFDFATEVTSDLTLHAQFSEEYLISYTNQDGTIVQTDKLKPGAAIYGPSQATLGQIVAPEGTRLIHWYDASGDATVAFTFGTGATAGSDMTFSPYFSNQYLVIFNSGGSYVEPQPVVGGETAVQPATPTRAGYDFVHWYIEGTNENTAFNFDTAIRADTVLVGKWAPKTVNYTVAIWMEKPNFDGTPTPGKNADYNYVTSVTLTGQAGTGTIDTNSLPASITSLFTGGHSLLKYGTPQSVESKEIQGNGLTVVNLYAARKVYTYTFALTTIDNNGRTYDTTMKIGGVTYQSGGTSFKLQLKYEQDISALWPVQGVSFATFDNTSSGNRRFTSTLQSWSRGSGMTWKDSAGIASIRRVLDDGFISENGQQMGYTVTSDWTKSTSGNIYRYFVQAWPNQDVSDEVTIVRDGVTYVLMEEYNQTHTSDLKAKTINGLEPVRDAHYTYYYSSSQNNYSTSSYGRTAHRVFLYTRTTQPLTFNMMLPDGETVRNAPASPQTLMFGQPLAAFKPAATPTVASGEYKFAGWYRDADYKEPFDFATLTMPIGGMTAYAKWESTANTVTLLDDRGGRVEDEQGVAKGKYAEDKYWAIGEFVPGKGNFLGWKYDISGIPVDWSWDTPVYTNYTLYATWATDGFGITYNAGAGSGEVPVDSNTYNMSTTARVLEGSGLTPPDGQLFYAWKDASGNMYYPGDFIDISENGDVELVAQYASAGGLVRVRYFATDASGQVLTNYVPTGSSINLAGEIFTQEGNKLIGWADSAGQSAAAYTFGQPYTVTAAKDFYGVWKVAGWTVEFRPGSNGTLTGPTTFEEITHGTLWGKSIVVEPTVNVNQGYYFTGWDPVLPGDDDAITGNMTFVARYAAKTAITVRPKAAEKPYDGTPLVATEFEVVGELPDGVTVDVTGDAYGGSRTNAGFGLDSYIKNTGYVTLGGANAHKYYVALERGTLTVNAVSLVITAGSKTNQTYTGQPIIVDSYTTPGLKTGDAVGGVTVYRSRTIVGTDTVVVENRDKLTITRGGGDVSGNYTVTYADGTLEIVAKEVTITVDNAKKLLGTDDPTFAGTVAELVNAGDLGEVTYHRDLTKYTDNEAVGTYDDVLYADFTPNPNYEVTVVFGDFEIINAYTVSFVAGAGGSLSGGDVTYGPEEAGSDWADYGISIPTPVPTNATTDKFTGWIYDGDDPDDEIIYKTNQDILDAFAAGTVDRDMLFTATFGAKQVYNITYTVTRNTEHNKGTVAGDPVGYTAREDQTWADAGATPPALTAITPAAGYEFTGWSSSPDSMVAWSYDAVADGLVDKDYTLYAWFTPTYSVNFVAGEGGSVSTPNSFGPRASGSSWASYGITAVPTPTPVTGADGQKYQFKNWTITTVANGTQTFDDAAGILAAYGSANVTENLTFTANFAKVYNVFYDAGDATPVPADNKDYLAGSNADVIFEVNGSVPQLAPLKFLGWDTNPDVAKEAITYPVGDEDAQITNIQGDVTLYAIWELDADKFEFEYLTDLNGVEKFYDAITVAPVLTYGTTNGVPENVTITYTGGTGANNNAFTNVVDTTLTANISFTHAGITYEGSKSATILIKPRPIIFQISDEGTAPYKNANYDLNPTIALASPLSATNMGLVSDHDFGILAGTAYTKTFATSEGAAVGPYTLNLPAGSVFNIYGAEGIVNGNYAVTIQPGAFEITQNITGLSVTLGNETKEYTGTAQTLTNPAVITGGAGGNLVTSYSLTGEAGSYTYSSLEDIISLIDVKWNTATPPAPAAYDIYVQVVDTNGYYATAKATGSLTITPRAVEFIITADPTWGPYDTNAHTPSTAVSVGTTEGTGLVGGDTYTAPTMAFEVGPNTGTYTLYWTVANDYDYAAGLTITSTRDTSAKGNYTITYTDGTYRITDSDALAVWMDPDTKVYSGAPQASGKAGQSNVAGATITYSLTGEAGTFTLTSPPAIGKDVQWVDGVNTPYTFYVMASAPNYTPVTAEATLTITPKAVAVTVTPEQTSVPYTGFTQNIDATVSYDGLITGEETYVTPQGEKAVQVSGKEVNTPATLYTSGLTVDEITVSETGGAKKGNYTFTITEAGLLITKAPFNQTGLMNAVFADITVPYDGDEHSLLPVSEASSPATLTYTLLTDKNRSTTTVRYSLTGEAGTFTLASPPEYTEAGSYPLWVQVTHDNFQTGVIKATLTIQPRNVTVTVAVNTEDKTQKYTGADIIVTAGVTFENAEAGGTTGLVNGDVGTYNGDNTVDITGKTVAGSPYYSAASDTYVTIAPGTKANYRFIYVDDTFSITAGDFNRNDEDDKDGDGDPDPKDPDDPADGDDDAMRASFSGLIVPYDAADHALTGVSVDYKNADDRGLQTVTYGTYDGTTFTPFPATDTTAAGAMPAYTEVGTYTIWAQVVHPNFETGYLDASLTITPATLTLTAAGGERVYNGESQTLSSEITASGLVGGHRLVSAANAENAATVSVPGKNVGTYQLASGTEDFIIVDGAGNPVALTNYGTTIARSYGALAITARPVQVTVTVPAADEQQKYTGEAIAVKGDVAFGPVAGNAESGIVGTDTATYGADNTITITGGPDVRATPYMSSANANAITVTELKSNYTFLFADDGFNIVKGDFNREDEDDKDGDGDPDPKDPDDPDDGDDDAMRASFTGKIALYNGDEHSLDAVEPNYKNSDDAAKAIITYGTYEGDVFTPIGDGTMPSYTNVDPGPYTIWAQVEHPNFETGYLEAILTINPRPVLVTITVPAADKEQKYTGTTIDVVADVSFEPATADSDSGIVNGDTATYGANNKITITGGPNVRTAAYNASPDVDAIAVTEFKSNYTFRFANDGFNIVKGDFNREDEDDKDGDGDPDPKDPDDPDDGDDDAMRASFTGLIVTYDGTPYSLAAVNPNYTNPDDIDGETVTYGTYADGVFTAIGDGSMPAYTNAGRYTVWAKLEHDNFETGYLEAILTINPRPITVTANDGNLLYNTQDQTVETLTIGDGRVVGDTDLDGFTAYGVGRIPNEFNPDYPDGYPVELSLDGTKLTDMTPFQVGNYLVTPANGTLVIHTDGFTWTWNIAAGSDRVTFDGAAHEVTAASATGLPTTLEARNVTAYGTGTNADTYPVTVTGYEVWDGDVNLTELFRGASAPSTTPGELVIDPLAITIDPMTGLSKSVNTADPDWSDKYSMTTLPGTISAAQRPQFSIERETGELIGAYDVNVVYNATSAVNSNYVITTSVGEFTIVAGPDLTATAPDVTVTYDGASHGIDVMVNLPATAPAGSAPTIIYYTPEEPARLTIQPEKINVGDSGIINFIVSLPGYGTAYGSATVTILPREITLTANSYSKGADEADPNFDGVMTGELVNANDLGLIDYGLKYATDDTSKEGAYALTATYDSNPNYNVTVVDGVLTVSDTTTGGDPDPDPDPNPDPDPVDPGPGPVTPAGDPDPIVPAGPTETTPTPPEDEPVREPAQPDESEPAQPDESTPAPIEQADPADP
ncbi:MAG: hypothetical protein GXY32_00060, partial [Ruminococcaceae bacterium]|nr:hypothetical protein [Oscillospiraceae bacterium]